MSAPPMTAGDPRATTGTTAQVVLASILGLGALAAMVLGAGTVLGAVLVVVLVVAQVLALGWRLRARPRRSSADRWSQFLLAWSGQAGLTHLVAGDASALSALVFLAVGVVFALIVVIALVCWPRANAVDDGPGGDTAPLPVDAD